MCRLAIAIAASIAVCGAMVSGRCDGLPSGPNDGSVIRSSIQGSRFTAAADASDWSVELGAPGFRSRYSRASGIVFSRRPTKECEFMATGTGETGVAVLTHDGLALQINQEGCFDEHGWYKVAGRLYLELEGDPLRQAAERGAFTMTHDLRRSVISIHAQTPDGPVDIAIRGYMTRDIIAVTIRDGRTSPGRVGLRIRTPWGSWYGAGAGSEGGQPVPADVAWQELRTKVSDSGCTMVWHDNGPKTDWHAINVASGVKDDSALQDPLADRCFGLGVATGRGVHWVDGRAELPASPETTLYIAAGAARGEKAFVTSLEKRLSSLPPSETLVREHEAWWRRYWSRVAFTSDASMRRPMVAYDMYRYFSAVASGRDREFPLRFQIDLLNPTLRYTPWLQMQINSIQTIEAYYPMMRNGDWDQLRPLLKHYERMLPVYRTYSHDYYGHPGLTIPYEPNVWGSDFFSGPSGDGWSFYSHASHPWSVYSFEHGIAIMQFLQRAAEAKGDASITRRIVLPYMDEQCRFLLQHYPTVDGRIVFDPATSGETWYNVRNPASWIHLLRAFLPHSIDLARGFSAHGLEQSATDLLARLPDAPKGRWRMTDSGAEIAPTCPAGDEVYLPAEAFHSPKPINAENPELYGVWPYGYVGADREREIALRTYERRFWKNLDKGWSLDAIWAAALGLTDEACRIYDDILFPATLRSPGGFSFEESATCAEEPGLPLYPSMQGMGASVCHIYEMLCRDTDDGIIVLPAWPMDKPVRAVIYSPLAGRTEISYTPGSPVTVATERLVKVSMGRR